MNETLVQSATRRLAERMPGFDPEKMTALAEALEEFSDEVRAEEREACARVAERFLDPRDWDAETAGNIVEAIRNRIET